MPDRPFSDREIEVIEAISRLTFCNPFLAERVELERRVLGDDFTPFFAVWHVRTDLEDDNPNVVRIAEVAYALADRLRDHLSDRAAVAEHELTQYQNLCLYVLYYRYQQRFLEMARQPERCDHGRSAPFWDEFRGEFERLLGSPTVRLAPGQTPEHVFACFFQVRRAFHFTFRSMAGGSLPAARLRSQVWQSIFTHDLRRYQRVLFDRMGDVTTLITGPSGAGKELVARAIGLSRYIPFDPRTRRFRESFEESFFALNLATLSPTLIESELFGHRRGSFTGAIADRSGWFEVCPPLGTVFLDEIGEIDASVQVKLLRVLETRTFQPLGSTDARSFRGKTVAATNRDIGLEMQAGRFREDLYYRLCADIVVAPSLRERIADSPDELRILLGVLAIRLVGEDEAPAVAAEAETWIAEHLGSEYDWPGNVRELSQCVSNVLIRSDYRPVATRAPTDAGEIALAGARDGALTADELGRRYCTLVYARTGSYAETARRLGLDRRTVRARIDATLLATLGGVSGAPVTESPPNPSR